MHSAIRINSVGTDFKTSIDVQEPDSYRSSEDPLGSSRSQVKLILFLSFKIVRK